MKNILETKINPLSEKDTTLTGAAAADWGFDIAETAAISHLHVGSSKKDRGFVSFTVRPDGNGGFLLEQKIHPFNRDYSKIIITRFEVIN